MRYLLLSLFIFSGSAIADCSTKQTFCEAQCKVKHLSDEMAEAGCNSKCVAERAACSAEKGADTAVDAGKKAWEGTKSFVKGLTE
ncbi:hypothetical protein [Marinobacterium jannaschii]|uniref:hypothetical protein n=1 Tax=Marinobacterium jannaschii TaxID=64970 RepID=UPI0004826643|nr:hypothetical protein [Marinobacterium jannaschii]